MSNRPEVPLVIAHRGASAYRPENTLPAYELAIDQKADMIEIDLHLTRDGEIVISHDAKLDHFGAVGKIGALSLAEVRELDAGHGKGRREVVPTLDEVLDGFGARIPFNLEIKWDEDAGDYPGLEARAVEAVEKRGLLERTLFSSFRDSILHALRRASASARLGVLVTPTAADRIFERAASVAAEAINPHFALVSEALVREAHERDLAVYSYTVNEAEAMRRMLDLGVDGLFTNHPDRMRLVLRG